MKKRCLCGEPVYKNDMCYFCYKEEESYRNNTRNGFNILAKDMSANPKLIDDYC